MPSCPGRYGPSENESGFKIARGEVEACREGVFYVLAGEQGASEGRKDMAGCLSLLNTVL